ncbi:MAG: DnaD domain protein [Streptococcus orisratti]|uniref:DnaD domain protein n=1 Tax=Streptococcus orisratti TaxID=114652 RepID=UPI002352AD20|nr:DnaD domain protein [Streptococcus orisratti]MCI7678150.1 DnaD domain protein [Streptococcus orisratti]
MNPIDDFLFLKHNRVSYDSTTLIQLYYPIMGSDALAVYEYLVAFFDNGAHTHKFSELLNHLQFGMKRLEEALVMLTALDLLVLYQTRDSYILKIKPALGNETFLADPVYRRLLELRIGEIAVSELEVSIPENARDISKTFSDVFNSEIQNQPKPSKTDPTFDLVSFQRLMTRDGLSFSENEKMDVIGLYAFADKYKMNWFEVYGLANETAINRKISLKRMEAKKQQPSQSQIDGDFTNSELVVIQQAKSLSALDFLKVIKSSRKAVVTKAERNLLEDLAQMSFLDEVINILVLYTFNKTKSANLSKPYLMTLANDFSYRGIGTAEAAVVALRHSPEIQKKNAAKQIKKSNVPEWSNPNYKNETSQEELAKLEAEKRQLLEKLGKE